VLAQNLEIYGAVSRLLLAMVEFAMSQVVTQAHRAQASGRMPAPRQFQAGGLFLQESFKLGDVFANLCGIGVGRPPAQCFLSYGWPRHT